MRINNWNSYNTQYTLLTKDNPYKKGILEYYLVEFIIEYLSLERKDEITSEKILDYLSIHKYEVESIDLWNLEKLKEYAISISKLNGIIRIKNKGTESLNFGLYIEDGLINPLHSSSFTRALKCVKNIKKRNELWEVLYINEKIRAAFNLPEIKQFSDGYELRLPQTLGAWDVGSIPISAWSYPGTSEEWLGLNSRGLFHHMGDEMAFIISALCYGNCYILGRDEFNDLIVLGVLDSCRNIDFSLYQKVSASDFSYIYGVPKGQELVMSKTALIIDSKNDCQINLEKNSEVENFWNNKAFLEFANRDCGSYSFSKLSELIESKALSSLKELNFDLHKINSFNLTESEIRDFKNILNLSEEYINFDVITDIDKKNINFYKDWKEIDSSAFSCEIKNIFNCLDGISEVAKYKSNSIVEDIYKDNHVKEYLCNKIKVIKEKLLQIPYLTDYLEGRLECIKKAVYDATSLFYKTKNHKVHCDIINPKEDLELGFFNKNEVEDKNFTEINYLDYIFCKKISSLLKDVTITGEDNSDLSFSNYLFKVLGKGLEKSTKMLFKYWKEVDSSSFFVSEIKKMENEYRVFIINNRAVSASPCFRDTTPFNAWNNGRFDPRLVNGHNAKDIVLNQETRNRVAKYAKFVRKFTKRMKELYPEYKNYVLDIAWSEDVGDVIPIEINSITWSGAYQINFGRVCAAIANEKYNYSNVIYNNYRVIKGANLHKYSLNRLANKNTLLEYKYIAQQNMIEDNIIEDFNLSLNGLERVLLSGNYTIPEYYKVFNEVKKDKRLLDFIESFEVEIEKEIEKDEIYLDKFFLEEEVLDSNMVNEKNIDIKTSITESPITEIKVY